MAALKKHKGIQVIEKVDGTKRFKVTISAGRDARNKAIREYKSFTSLTEAITWQQERKMQILDGYSPKFATMLVPVAFELWYKTYKAAQITDATKASYIGNINRLKRYMGQLKLRDLTRTKIQMIFNRWSSEGMSKATQLKIKNRLAAFTRAMVAEGALIRDPMIDIQIKELNRDAAKKIMDLKNYELMIQALERKAFSVSSTFDIIIYTALLTGMWSGELVGLDWANVHLDDTKPYLEVVQAYTEAGGGKLKEPKTKSSVRKIPLAPRLVKKLKLWRAYQHNLQFATGIRSNTNMVFVKNDGSMPYNNTINRRFYRLQTELNINKEDQISVHGARHTWATWAVTVAQMPISYVSAILGHANQSITAAIYLHNFESVLEKQNDDMLGKLESI